MQALSPLIRKALWAALAPAWRASPYATGAQTRPTQNALMAMVGLCSSGHTSEPAFS